MLYMGVAGALALVALIFIWEYFFTAPPTCFDGKKDGNELGVDCGGSCALLCPSQTRDPLVLWARAFPNGPSTAAAAAYIENDNVNAAAKQVPYSFRFYDADNNLIIEHDGVADLPPLQTIPIVEPVVDVGNRVVARTLFAFSQPPVWYTVMPTSIPLVTVSNQELATDGSRLTAKLNNGTIDDVHNLAVVAVLFDADNIARAASKSVIPVVSHQSSTDVVFTWSPGVPNIVRAEITVLPSF